MSETTSSEAIVGDPAWLPQAVDPAARMMLFRPANSKAVRDAAFIDGRTDIWADDGVSIAFDRLVLASTTEISRYILHMSFCGSTLLARLIDVPGKVLTLREPDVLVSLADWKSALLRRGEVGGDFDKVTPFALAMLKRRWEHDESVVVKPSSWANNLVTDLVQAETEAVFVTIEPEEFAMAVLRGGRDRLAFTARLAAHLAPSVKDGTAMIQSAIDSVGDPLAKALRLALIARHFEHYLFQLAPGRHQTITFGQIERDPAAAAEQAASALGLALTPSEIDANVSRWAGEHAKGNVQFSTAQRAAENEDVRRFHGAMIADAVTWAEKLPSAG